MTWKPPYRDDSSIKERLHQRIRRLDHLLSDREQEKEPGLSSAVKVLLVLATIVFLFVCLIPVLIFLQLLFR